jgi:predicted NUDIX family phosphoesterase
MSNKKHPGWILAIDADYCARFFQQGFNAMSLKRFIEGLPAKRVDPKTGKDIHFTDDLASRTLVRERFRLEFDPRFLQPLNYLVIKQNKTVPSANLEGQFCSLKQESFYSTYYRQKGVGEDRLSDKMSIGWGGHSEYISAEFDSKCAINYIATAQNNIVTELREELRLTVAGLDHEIDPAELTIVFKGFIYDMSDDVGRHHLALVWEVDLPESIDLESRENEQLLGPMCNRQELAKMKRERTDLFENWSNIVIDQINAEGWDLLGTDKDWMSGANAEAAFQAAEAEVSGMLDEKISASEVSVALEDIKK